MFRSEIKDAAEGGGCSDFYHSPVHTIVKKFKV